MKIHAVFHVLLLELTTEDLYPGRIQTPPPPVVVDGEEKYEVDEVPNSLIHWKRLRYLVKWGGYEQPDLMSVRNINIFAVIDEFHTLYTDRLESLLEDR